MKIRISTKCLVFAYLLVPCGLIKLAHAIPPFVAPVPIYLYDAQGGLGNGSVAIAGNTLAIAGSSGTSGLVYIYQLTNGVWVESARLSTSDAQVNVNGPPGFGSSIAVSPDGETIFVGDPTAACAASANLPCGAVDIYQEPLSGWSSTDSPTAQLVPSTAASQELGYRVALSSDGTTLAALGDAVYVFIQPPSGWANGTQTATLGTASGQGANGALVGLGVDGGVVATNTTGQSVLVYMEPSVGWQDTANPTATLTSSATGFDSQLGDFGSQLKVAGNVILIGAPAISKALVYQEPAGGWTTTNTATAELRPPTNSVGFARGINMVGNTAVVSDGNQVVYYDEPAGGWSSESETGGTNLPSDPSMYSWPQLLSSESGSIYVTGSELVTSSNPQYDEGILPMFIGGYVLSDTPAGSNYDGMMIDSVTVNDLTTSGVRVTSGFTGDELQFNLDVQNVKAPDSGTGTFQATGSGGTLTTVTATSGGNCQLSNGVVTCNLLLAAGQSTTIGITEQTSAIASQANVTATLSNVNPQSWDPLDATLTATLSLTPAPVVPVQVTFTGAPGSTISNTLPVTYIGKNSLMFTIVYQPLDGSLTVNSQTGAFTWTPPSTSYGGKTQFTYEVSDGVDTSAASTVTINESSSTTISSGSGGGGQVGVWSLLMLTAIVALLYLRRRKEF